MDLLLFSEWSTEDLCPAQALCLCSSIRCHLRPLRFRDDVGQDPKVLLLFDAHELTIVVFHVIRDQPQLATAQERQTGSLYTCV